MAPIVDFLGTKENANIEKPVYKAKENITKSTCGDNVIEICNINFEDDFAQDEIEEMLEKEDPEVNAVKLYKSLGMRYGFHELYKAEENHTHKLHQVVSTVFRALPSLNPAIIETDFEEFVRLGILENLPMGLMEMLESPRYFPGRKVLVKATDTDEFQSSNEDGITKIGKIMQINEDSCKVELDPFENYGKDIKLDISNYEIVKLNNPHKFHREPNGKYTLEDGMHASYENKTVKAKLIEIGFLLNKLVNKMNYLKADCLEFQKEAVLLIRSCLNIVTFQSGVDRSRCSRSDNIGRLAVNGQVCSMFMESPIHEPITHTILHINLNSTLI